VKPEVVAFTGISTCVSEEGPSMSLTLGRAHVRVILMKLTTKGFTKYYKSAWIFSSFVIPSWYHGRKQKKMQEISKKLNTCFVWKNEILDLGLCELDSDEALCLGFY
jgi:hypothetical protein